MTDIVRKLASIRRIKQLLPIDGADRIEIAIVDGWQVVVQKNLYNVGDLVVYLEIDSWVPTTIAPFLTGDGKEPKEYNGVKGERLKTIKLRKQLSQGLLLPLTLNTSLGDRLYSLNEGDDVTEELGIQKWEPAEKESNPNQPNGAKNRPFPYFLRKTDQERAQNYGKLIELNLDTEFEVTVKKDGSSMTVFRVNPNSRFYKDAKARDLKELSWWERVQTFFHKDEPVYGICSRNQQLRLEGNSNFHKAAEPLLLELAGYNEGSVALQAEVVAPDIQGNYEKVSSVEAHIFDVFDIDQQEYKTPRDRRSFLGVMFAGTHVPHVTVVDKGTLRSIIQYKEGDDVVAKLLTYATGEGDNPSVQREGVVFKAEGKDFSFKVISNEYLLHKKD
jgi:RNA ligase (TIGR02306 family)